MPTELTVGLGGKGHLSGRLSEDLDNTDIPWAVSVLRVVQGGVIKFALVCKVWQTRLAGIMEYPNLPGNHISTQQSSFIT